jgi:hypothetical protein
VANVLFFNQYDCHLGSICEKGYPAADLLTSVASSVVEDARVRM